MLAQFEADVAATGSEKEQRLIIRKLLMQSGTFCCSAMISIVLDCKQRTGVSCHTVLPCQLLAQPSLSRDKF